MKTVCSCMYRFLDNPRWSFGWCYCCRRWSFVVFFPVLVHEFLRNMRTVITVRGDFFLFRSFYACSRSLNSNKCRTFVLLGNARRTSGIIIHITQTPGGWFPPTSVMKIHQQSLWIEFGVVATGVRTGGILRTADGYYGCFDHHPFRCLFFRVLWWTNGRTAQTIAMFILKLKTY